ncbi:amidohydrolase family protein [Candidatus Giovannonibacteria bacterium]|nr:amidohydrolase family protein [Candidatus Giovannonibacteria bacterium]
MAFYSILIRNGIILDGTGNKPYRADIGITEDKIKDIGDLSNATANEIINAMDYVVCPGFIDLTSHSDTYGTIFSSLGQESMLKQGVTTILVGNCGESLAPILNKDSLSNLSLWSKIGGFNINWNSMDGYYSALEKNGIGTNFGSLVGTNTLLKNSKNIGEASLLLRRSFEEGAWGLSSNLSVNGSENGFRVNLLELLRVVKEWSGVHKVHLADEGRNLLPSVSVFISIARESGAKTVISHFKAIGRAAWKDFNKALQMIMRAKEEGVEIYIDTFPYLRTGSMLLSLIPGWAKSGSREEVLKNFADAEFVKKIITNLENITLHPEKIVIASALRDKNIVGRTLAEVSEAAGIRPEEMIIEILKVNELNVNIFGQTLHEKNLFELLKNKDVFISSDGAGYNLDSQNFGDLVHPRSFGSYARFFSKIGKEAELSPEEIIMRFSSMPAKVLGISDRGQIKEKFVADIAIFDPEAFKDTATYKNPFRYAEGMKFVIVGGKIALRDGEFENKKAGAALRKRGSSLKNEQIR